MLFLFKSTHDVIKAEKCCHKQGIKCKIVPIPRSISTECGMGIEAKPDQIKTIIELFNNNKITHKIHKQTKK
jgi:hypothetical protein